jgi:HSP20 family protein
MFTPSVEVEETENEVRVTAELPGLEEKDFELGLEGGVLTLRGEQRHESEDRKGGWSRSERVYGRFERHVPLPCEVESERARAEFRKGVLTVTLPKTPEARERRVRIPVQAS